MKKTTFLVLGILLMAAPLAIARMPGGSMEDQGMQAPMMKGDMDRDMDQGMMMHHKMKYWKRGTCPICEKMMSEMMERKLIATSDGGLVLLAGDKLIKFDRNLNVVKEVEIKMDMTGIQKMMEQMKGTCPYHKKMMRQEKSGKAAKK